MNDLPGQESLQFKSIPQYSIRLVKESAFQYSNHKMSSATQVVQFLEEIGLQDKAVEEFHALYLNVKNQIIGMEMVSKGTLTASMAHPREVFKGAILANAYAIIIAHNHPSGDVQPSTADKQTTETLVGAGKLLNIRILDHVIIGQGGGYFSFRNSTSLIDE